MLSEVERRPVRIASIWVVAAGLALAEPTVILDNGAIRVEIDPQVFAVCYVGIPGEANFLSPLPVDAAARDPAAWVDAGGLQTDLLPLTRQDAAVRRGPAKVIEQRKDYVALLGPPSAISGMQVKKEVQLLGTSPRARFRVSVLRVGAGEDAVSIRNTARVGPGVTLRLDRSEGAPRMLAGSETLEPYFVKSRKYWIIPVPSTSPARGVIAGALVSTVSVVNRSSVWRRHLAAAPRPGDVLPKDCSVLCLLDDPTQTYGVAMQGPTASVRSGAITALEEDWEVEARAR
jgi:hypothetical protein